MNRVKLDEHLIVENAIQQIGNKIVLGTPPAAGKANHIINAFYKKAKEDDSIDLTICTALTLERPKGKSELEKRFIELFEKRIFGDYPDLLYELDRNNGKLPENIRVLEFYFPPGKYIGNEIAQRNYISSNYTHAVRDLLDREVNVIVQMVAKKDLEGEQHYSLSCNPDVTLDMSAELLKQNKPLVKIAQVNQNLPFMFGDAVVQQDFFDYVMDDPEKYYTVFGPPKMSVSEADFMIGLYSSTLVVDDGELQIGIGSLGDSTVYNLLLRHQHNDVYNEILTELDVLDKFGDVIEKKGDTKSFEVGLFGASEMLIDGFMHLYDAGIIKKKVFDDYGLQRLINKSLIKEYFDEDILEVLAEHKIIHYLISKLDFKFLQKWGIFRQDLDYIDGRIITSHGASIIPQIRDQQELDRMKQDCLGTHLENGQILQGGFFLGPQSFYTKLRELPDDELRLINMRSIQKINQLYGHERLDRLHRKNARFVNSCMMQTLTGAAVSDALENGQVISGVGGQYNFVAMAQELPDGHSILNLRSTRKSKGKIISNIVPTYGHITIPRHLRDIVITEYGIAYIRGCTDEEVIKRLLNISDSRFQDDLMSWAKEMKKLDKDYQIPAAFRNNTPDSYESILKKYKNLGYYNAFPFGTDLTDDELKIGKALKLLKAELPSKLGILKSLIKGFVMKPNEDQLRLLKMMRLDNVGNMKERVYQKLLLSKLPL